MAFRHEGVIGYGYRNCILTDSLDKWIKAVRANDFDAAKLYAKDLTLAGELLVIHPDFLRAFHEHGNGVDPKEALVHLRQFLLAATDGRAKHLNGQRTL